MKKRLSRAVALWILAVPIAAAQTLEIGPERALEVPPRPVAASNVRLAGNGDGFTALWQTQNGELVSGRIDADGQLLDDSTHVLTRDVSFSAIASNAAGELAAWRTGELLVWSLIPRDGSAPEQTWSWSAKGMLDVDLAANDRDFVLAWSFRGEYAAVRIAVIDAEGRMRALPLALITDASAGPVSIACDGSNVLAAWRTARGVETALIDASRVSVLARNLLPDFGGDPILVSTASGPALYFSLSLNGWNDDAATYRVELTGRGAAVGEPELVAFGRLLEVFDAGGAPVLVVRNDGATEIVGLPLRFDHLDAIAWNGVQFLIAAGRPVDKLIVAGRQGDLLRTAVFGLLERSPLGIATAGDVSFVRWREGQSLRPSFYGRFRDGRLLDAPPRVIPSGGPAAIASDGTSAFLIAFRDSWDDVYADLVPIDGPLAPPVLLGKGTPQAAIWDGSDFLVFWVQANELRAGRVHADGTVLASAKLSGPDNLRSVAAAPTKSGFLLAIGDGGYSTTYQAFDPSMRSLGSFTSLGSPAPLALASDRGERIVAGVYRGGGDDTNTVMLRLDDRASGLWAAALPAMRSVVWSRGVFVSCSTSDCVLFDADQRLTSGIRDHPRFPLPRHDGEFFLAAENGQPLGLYARRIEEADGRSHLRMFTRTFTVLPKPESAP